MKLFVLVATPLLVASSTLARSPLRRGPSADTCANLDVDLVIPNVDGKSYVAGHIDIGLCISQVKMFVGHYNVTEAAVKVVGVDKVEAAVTDLIKKAGVECSYPPHATPSVTSRNECSFVCKDGFLAMPPHDPTSCICPVQMKECDGKCGHFNSDCSIARPPSRRENDPKCAEHLTMCGVPDATAGEAYKCTDVTSDSATCGGCVKASAFGSPSTDGLNCHKIPNVDEVSCLNGKCVVRTCKSGFTTSVSNEACVPNVPGKNARALPAPGNGQIPDNIPVAIAEGETEMVVPGGIVRKVSGSRTDTVSGPVHKIVSAAMGVKVPRGCGVGNSQC